MNRALSIVFLTVGYAVFPQRAVALTWPFSSGVSGYQSISGTLGECRHITGTNLCDRYHFGTDITPCHATVKAAESGTATYHAFSSENGYMVDINEKYFYLHLEPHAARIEPVTEDDPIGISSNTGAGVPCHLHFQIGQDGDYTNVLSVVSIPDMQPGSIAELIARSGATEKSLEAGTPINLSSFELIVKANDISNNGSNKVNWAHFRAQADGGPAKQDFMFMQGPLGGSTWPQDPNAVYSNTSPQSTYSPFVTYYRMGTFNLSEGQHQICVYGWDYNNATTRLSTTHCVSVMVGMDVSVVGEQSHAVRRAAVFSRRNLGGERRPYRQVGA